MDPPLLDLWQDATLTKVYVLFEEAGRIEDRNQEDSAELSLMKVTGITQHNNVTLLSIRLRYLCSNANFRKLGIKFDHRYQRKRREDITLPQPVIINDGIRNILLLARIRNGSCLSRRGTSCSRSRHHLGT